MNHLRSVAFAVVSTSMLVVAAGCNAGSDITEEAAPRTEIASGVAPKAWTPPATVCPAKDEPFYQVQASRVSKYLFGGNDPWDMTVVDPATGALAGDSPEFGPAGSAPPKVGDGAACDAAAACWRAVHDALYPVCSGGSTGGEGDKGAIDPKAGDSKDGRYIDPKAAYRTSTTTQCPAPSAQLGGGDEEKACGLPAELFTLHVSDYSFPHDLGKCIMQLDACWGDGVSGFMYLKDPQKQIVGFDPEPADLKSNLAGGFGATAAATWTSVPYVWTNVVLWPASPQVGSWPPGTPCSPWGLPAGTRTTKAIVASGSMRMCL